jgi:hypothetical protein
MAAKLTYKLQFCNIYAGILARNINDINLYVFKEIKPS